MKNIIKNTLLILGIVVSCGRSLLAQTPSDTTYIRMTDASGFNTDSYQTALQLAADSLVAAFPGDFKQQFKVYDFGFYLHNESYSGGYPEAFQLAIDDVAAKSPYYLLFGKQTDVSGIYTKFWVDLKLPTTGELDCLPLELMGLIKNQVSRATSSRYFESGNFAEEYHFAEKVGMRWLRNFISDKVSCCKGGEDFNYCSSCAWEQDIAELLLLNGYSLAEVTNLNVDTTFVDTSGVFKQYANISGTIGDTTLNFNDDLLPFITELAQIDSSITGQIRYYQSSNCQEIAASVSGNSIAMNAAKPADGVEEDESSYLIYDVIVFDYDGKYVVATNYQTNWFDFSLAGNHTFYMYASEDIPWPLSLEGVKDSLEEFLDLAGISAMKIEVPSKVKKFYGYTDGVFFVTEHRSYIKTFIIDYPYILGIQESNGNIMEVLDNYANHTNPEYTFLNYIGLVSLDKSGSLGFSEGSFDDGENYNRVFLNNGESNYNRIVAFIALHVAGHQAGFSHHISNSNDALKQIDEGRGFMWGGTDFGLFLKKGEVREYEAKLLGLKMFNHEAGPRTFEDLILFTKQFFPIMGATVEMRYSSGVLLRNQVEWK